ncbi:hypothetical protein I4F81_006800 [Pyropia yezoensis]|uniref:Uncharacterized protein n=1 Tax=Pyropia yezoensis TaxID=2788 RepID=A0ACC3C2R0_PYRYE|nr:hypothetical protein I4F81_006800 [Neopyropia yezoensis]
MVSPAHGRGRRPLHLQSAPTAVTVMAAVAAAAVAALTASPLGAAAAPSLRAVAASLSSQPSPGRHAFGRADALLSPLPVTGGGGVVTLASGYGDRPELLLPRPLVDLNTVDVTPGRGGGPGAPAPQPLASVPPTEATPSVDVATVDVTPPSTPPAEAAEAAEVNAPSPLVDVATVDVTPSGAGTRGRGSATPVSDGTRGPRPLPYSTLPAGAAAGVAAPLTDVLGVDVAPGVGATVAGWGVDAGCA